MDKRGFTLIELMVVVIIVGVLASIAFPRYIRVVEKGRTAEARHILGMIRSAESSYFFEYDAFSSNLNDLQLSIPVTCVPAYYFKYSLTGGGGVYAARAFRCTAGEGGKDPGSPAAYELNITQTGVLSGTAGFM